ncbi:MAG: hypothetical protein ACOVP1_08985 [Bacteroidia bacterium]
MKSKFFWMLIFSCFLSPLLGQVNLVELKQNGESVYLSFSDISKPGIINCSVPNIGSVQCLGVSNCKECEELAMGSNRAYAIQQGKKFLIGDLPKGAKITESMYLIPISMKEKLVKCNCKEKSIYSNFAGDCESACQIAIGGKEPVGYPIDTVYQGANGAGTRNSIPRARGRPGLRHETAPKPDKENTLANSQNSATTGKGIDTGNSITQGKPSLIGLEQEGIHTTTYNSIMSKNGSNPKPKQETTTLGEISALAPLKKTGTTEGEVYTTNQSAPKLAEVKTLGDLVSYRQTNEKDSPDSLTSSKLRVPPSVQGVVINKRLYGKPKKNEVIIDAKENTLANSQNSATTGKGIDTGNSITQGKPSLIGLEQEGIHTTTYNSIMSKNGSNPKPKQETTTLGEISALAPLKKTGTTEGEVYTTNQSAPKLAEVKTLGDLVSYRQTNEKDSPDSLTSSKLRVPPSVQGVVINKRLFGKPKKNEVIIDAKENTLANAQNSVKTGKGIDTGNSITQGKPSLIGLEQDGIHTTTYNSIMSKNGSNPKPKQETTTLGEISALAELKTTVAGNANEFLAIQATQRNVNVEESYKALISSSGKTSIIPLYQPKAGDPGFYKESFWPKMYLASDTTYIASNNKVSVLTQKSVLFFHVQFLSGNKQAVNEICFPVQIDAISKSQGAAYLLNTMLEIKNMVLQSEELKGKSVETKTYVSEYPKPYSLVMPYLTEEGQLFMVSSESGVALSFLSPKISMVLQKSILNGFKQTYKP